MIYRDAMGTIERQAKGFPVIAIIGPRQSGKTTLAKLAFPKKPFVSFDDEQMRAVATENPQDFLLAFPDGCIIDEAQRVPKIFNAVKYYVDKAPSIMGLYILTGSNRFSLKHGITESLAGRVAYINLLPFSVGELSNAGILTDDPFRMMVKGQYPPLYDRDVDPQDWYQAYIETYLERDVGSLVNPGNKLAFKKFISLCAHRSGQLLVLSALAKECEVSIPTISSWLSILESSFIVYLMEPFFSNLGKRLTKTPKLFFLDSGLLCHLLRIHTREELILSQYKGHVTETFAIYELLKERFNQGRPPELSFYRDKNGLEVDAIAQWNTKVAIEVKSSTRPNAEFQKNLMKFVKLDEKNTYETKVFYLGDRLFTINGTDYVPWQKWTKGK
jgi:predicted AAA+ superfamily ATPase